MSENVSELIEKARLGVDPHRVMGHVEEMAFALGYEAALSAQPHVACEWELSRDAEPPIGTWAKDKWGGSTLRGEGGWGLPGFFQFGAWGAMWDARGPYVKCGPWGVDL